MENNILLFTDALANMLQIAQQQGIKVTISITADEKRKPEPVLKIEEPKIPVSKDQYDVLMKDLEGLPGVAKDIMNFYNIPTLAQLPVCLLYTSPSPRDS